MKIQLDRKKLLGFRMIDASKSGSQLGAKLGAKVGGIKSIG